MNLLNKKNKKIYRALLLETGIEITINSILAIETIYAKLEKIGH
jgi:hypothetical protein